VQFLQHPDPKHAPVTFRRDPGNGKPRRMNSGFLRTALAGGIAALALASPALASITLNGTTYSLTSGTYGGYSDWEQAVDAEFGTASSVADFATLKLDSSADADALWNYLVGELEIPGAAYVKWNGVATASGMPIFLELHASDPGPGWAVLDNIDDSDPGYPTRIDLGRWDLGNQRVLAVVAPVPEPSAALLGSFGLLLLLRKRRA
jgi:hypothetical protein